jgi:hypothetical protein
MSCSTQTMPLPTEVLKMISDAVKRRPDANAAAVLAEVTETVHAKPPYTIAMWIDSAGGSEVFVEGVVAEVRRLKAIVRRS